MNLRYQRLLETVFYLFYNRSNITINFTDNVCSTALFQCQNGQCIGWNSWCDGQNDCADGSDEINCGMEVFHVSVYSNVYGVYV